VPLRLAANQSERRCTGHFREERREASQRREEASQRSQRRALKTIISAIQREGGKAYVERWVQLKKACQKTYKLILEITYIFYKEKEGIGGV
jgi:hypothetical protein